MMRRIRALSKPFPGRVIVSSRRSIPSTLPQAPSLSRQMLLRRSICRERDGACGSVDGMDRREETITLPGNGFDKARILRIILNGRTEFLQGGVEAAVKINVSTLRPERLPELFAGDDLAGSLQKQ